MAKQERFDAIRGLRRSYKNPFWVGAAQAAKWVRNFMLPLLIPMAHALPTDFNDKVEAALLCRSEWSTAYWQTYFDKHLQKPLRDWGEARWWSSQGANLGGVASLEVFLNLDQSSALMVGVLIQQPMESVKKTLEAHYKFRFKPITGIDGPRYISDTLSVLAETRDKQQTKWYCARWNMGNRERVAPFTSTAGKP